MSRFMVTMPDSLFMEIELTTKETKTRSQFLRQALIQYLENYKKQKLDSLMAEGYQEMAHENLADAQALLKTLDFPQAR
jgi:CopG family transcriptional regulator/antitoxin EndoAI